MLRLLNETEKQFQDPGHARQQQDISQLRAAASSRRSPPPSGAEAPFKDDLAKASKAAPLLLGQHTLPEPLKRDQRAALTGFVHATGARSTPDQLLAAATFLVVTAGRGSFARRELISLLREVQGSRFAKEDSLSAFGQLQRAGKIVNAAHAGFTVPQEWQVKTPS